MKIMLFVGSGVSLKSGAPDVQKITSEILGGNWRSHTDSNYYAGKENAGPDFKVIRVQKFLAILKGLADSYLMERRGIIATYEDLFYLAYQIENEIDGPIDNPLVKSTVEKVHLQSVDIVKPCSPLEIEYDLARLASDSRDFIECVVWHMLGANKVPKGFEMLEEIVGCQLVDRLDICTLNHDLLVENYLDEKGIAYADGFRDADGEVRWFDPAIYESEENRVTLQKLHGSINWWYLEHLKRRKYGIVKKGLRPMLCKDHNGIRVDEIGARPNFLSGSYNKITDYRHGIFVELHNRFFRILKENDTILMSGYGWNDSGINGWLYEWLNSSDENRIVLLHENPELLKHSKSSLRWRYQELTVKGQLIPIKKWFSDATFDDVLKSLGH